MKYIYIFLLGLMAIQANGDGRRYVWTYEYQTLPRGTAELESYTEFLHSNTDSSQQATTILQYEYEIGMNDQFDAGIYQIFKQMPGVPLAYDGFKIRLRYQLGESGKWFMDPLIYLEYKDNAAFSQSALETKLILAKDLDQFNVSINPVLEIDFSEAGTRIEFEYTAGASYRVHRLVSLGLETKGNMDDFYWGPTLSHGENDLWFALGLLVPGTAGNSLDRRIRFIIGVGI